MAPFHTHTLSPPPPSSTYPHTSTHTLPHLHGLEGVLQLPVLPAQVLKPCHQQLEPPLGMLERRLVLLIVLQRVLKILHLLQRHRQRLEQLLVLLPDVRHELLVDLRLRLHLRHLVLQ